MPRSGRPITVPDEVLEFLSELEEATGVKGKGQILLMVKRLCGDAIKQHIAVPLESVPNYVPGTPQVHTLPPPSTSTCVPGTPKSVPGTPQVQTEPKKTAGQSKLERLRSLKIS